MKKGFSAFFALLLSFSLAGCSASDKSTGNRGSNATGKTGKAMVVYFSATGNTGRVANTIAEHIDSPIYELKPVDAYSNSDLNWSSSTSRVVKEHESIVLGKRADIELENVSFDGFDDADYIFLGAPVWWQQLSWVVENFVAENDFSNKTIIPFGTSSSSNYNLNNLTPLTEDDENVTWLDPQRFSSSVSDKTVTDWIDGLDIDFYASTVEAPGEGPQSASAISSVGNVPLISLNNGIEMPQFGLGTQVQSLENGELGILNQAVRESVKSALASGYRHLDSAHGYMNERGVGQGIIDSGVPRNEIWLTSKLWPSEYKNAYQAIDNMLDRLQTDYLDLVYLHHPAGSISDIETAWRDMERAYREGKIRALGISNFDNRMEAFNAIMDEEIKPQIMQIECHPFAQRLEARKLATQYDILVECWYPLGHADQRLLNSAVLEEIASDHSKSVVQTIIRWHIQEGFSVIPGSTNPDHIAENIDVFDFSLSNEEMEKIRSMDEGEKGRHFNINYSGLMGNYFVNNPPENGMVPLNKKNQMDS